MAVPANAVIEVKVLGASFGQSVHNIMHYRVQDFAGDPVDNLIGWLTSFRTDFRAQILPLLTTDYAVLEYRASVVEGMLWDFSQLDENDDPFKAVMRFSDQAALTGHAVDDKGTDAPPSHPTSTAVTVQKVCGPFMSLGTDLVPPADPVQLAFEKRGRGGMRFGVIAEDTTQALNGNLLEGAYVTAWEAALGFLLNVTCAGPAIVADMCVVSTHKNGAQRVKPEGGLPTIAVANVSSVAVSSFVSTQTSRKQRGTA